MFAALGQQETILRDLGSALSYGTQRKRDVSDLALTSEQRKALNVINAIISERCLFINRPDNGGAVGYLGLHRLYIITQADADALLQGDEKQRYGVPVTPALVAFAVAVVKAIALSSSGEDSDAMAKFLNDVTNPKSPGDVTFDRNQNGSSREFYDLNETQEANQMSPAANPDQLPIPGLGVPPPAISMPYMV